MSNLARLKYTIQELRRRILSMCYRIQHRGQRMLLMASTREAKTSVSVTVFVRGWNTMAVSSSGRSAVPKKKKRSLLVLVRSLVLVVLVLLKVFTSKLDLL